MKTQTIRLLDVFIIGPLMLYAAKDIKNPAVKAGLIISGLATVIYNAQNYIKR